MPPPLSKPKRKYTRKPKDPQCPALDKPKKPRKPRKAAETSGAEVAKKKRKQQAEGSEMKVTPWKVVNAWDYPNQPIVVPQTSFYQDPPVVAVPLVLEDVHDTSCSIVPRNLVDCDCWGDESMSLLKKNLEIDSQTGSASASTSPAQCCRKRRIDEDAADFTAPTFSVTTTAAAPPTKSVEWLDVSHWFPALFADCPKILKQGAHIRVCPKPGARMLHLMLANGRIGLDLPIICAHPEDINCEKSPFYCQHHYCLSHDRYEQKHLTRSMPLSPIVWMKCK